MGNIFGFYGKELNICMVGLDGAGKTTIMNFLLNKSIASTQPTKAYNLERFKISKSKICVTDMAGQENFRPAWRDMCFNKRGLVFVIDSSDHERLAEARESLQNLISSLEEEANIPLLVMANKKDLPNAMTPNQLQTALASSLSDRKGPTSIVSVSGRSGDGLRDSFKWLVQAIKNE